MLVGVLALQGCIDPHIRMFERIGVACVKVSAPEHLRQIDRLVLPGGESTTMLRLLKQDSFFSELKAFCEIHPVWGVCAGAILLAQTVTHPSQSSLGILPIETYRNFYGSQHDSFKASIEVPSLHITLQVDFIRAPRISLLSPAVEVLAVHDDNPVFLKHNSVIVTAFHTELGTDSDLHQFFVKIS